MSNELIKVTKRDGRSIVSARELYLGLGLNESNWGKWYKRNIEQNEFFDENVDFTPLVPMTSAKNEGNFSKDFAITIDFAKHIAMMARTSKSHDYRNYFIECEEKLKSNQALLPNTYKEALLQLVAQVEQNEILELENKQQKQIIKEYTPKATYYDEVLKSVTPITITQIAKDYGITAQEMNKKLHDLKVQFKQSGVWLLYDKYADKGYTKSETTYFTKPNKETGTSIQTKWTQKGRLFIYDLFKNNDILPVIEQVV